MICDNKTSKIYTYMISKVSRTVQSVEIRVSHVRLDLKNKYCWTKYNID